jgi:hypothetical protein
MRYRDENGQGWPDIIDLLSMYPDARRRVVRLLGELRLRPTPRPSGHRSAAVCLVTLSVATEAQVIRHMCWSSGFDPFEGSTLGSRSVPGGRTDRSREPSGLEP